MRKDSSARWQQPGKIPSSVWGAMGNPSGAASLTGPRNDALKQPLTAVPVLRDG